MKSTDQLPYATYPCGIPRSLIDSLMPVVNRTAEKIGHEAAAKSLVLTDAMSEHISLGLLLSATLVAHHILRQCDKLMEDPKIKTWVEANKP